MTLRWKTLLLMASTLSVVLLLLWTVTRAVLLDGFARTERQQVSYVVTEVNRGLQASGRELASRFRRWSSWDNTYNYVVAPTPDYLRSNLTDLSIDALDVDCLVLLDARAKPVFATFWNTTQKRREPVAPALAAHFAPADALLALPTSQSVQTGIVALPAGPMLVAALPIHTSNRAGPRHGTLIVGRYLSAARLQKMVGNSEDSVSMVALDALNPSWITTLTREQIRVVPVDADRVAGYQVVRGFYGVPQWALRVELPRDAMRQGHQTLAIFGWILSAAGALACALALYPIERLVLRRVWRLARDVRAVRGDPGQARRVRVVGRDELGQLAQDINVTLHANEEAQAQKTASQALHQEMAQAALAAGDCFFVTTLPDPDSGNSPVLEWHGAIHELLGLPAGEFPRTLGDWQKFVHPEDWPLLGHSYELAARSGRSFSLEIRVRRADGRELFWLHRGKLLRETTAKTGGEPARLLGMCLDITARKVAESARRRTEARLARIAETAADAIMLYDASGNVIFANPAAARVFGRPVEELWSLSYEDAQWGDCTLEGRPLALENRVFRRVERERGPVYEMQYRVKRPDGEMVDLSVNATPLPEDGGRFGGVVASFSDITERRRLEARLQHQAFHDPLTGLANRALVNNRLNHTLIAGRRQAEAGEVAVLFIDLDNFKWVNDSLGHDAGDVLLCEVASRLQKTLRAGDTPARFGGDEFVVILGRIETPNYAFAVAERIVALLSEAFLLEGREVFTSPSIGLAFSETGIDADTLLRNADAAMYEAKRRGKGRYEVFRHNLSAAAIDRLELEGDLRRALSQGEMGLCYQPKIDLTSGAICGVEALARWEHPRRGAVSPAEFIPIAEATGLIVPLGRWFLHEACRQTQQWNLTRSHPLSVAVNVSPRQFHNGLSPLQNGETAETAQLELVRDVATALRETGLPPHLLTLEITETVLMERTHESLEVLSALSKLGVQLAIDDFGTGYSSLAYLRSFPFDFLKIDREFVRNINLKEGHSVIVGAIIQLAHTLGLQVIAEGAEVAGEVEMLRAFSCDQAQGYFYARPLPPTELEELLAAENLIGK